MIERTKAAIHKENHRKQLQACSTSATVSGHPRVRSRSNSFVGENAVVQCQTSGYIGHIRGRCRGKVQGSRGRTDMYICSMTNQSGVILSSRKGL